MTVHPTGVRHAILVAFAGCLVACSGSAGQPATPSSSPTLKPPPTPQLALRSASFLDVRLLVPTGWTARRTLTRTAAGTIQYNSPTRHGTVYVEQNDCAACVDQGLVTHGRRNGVPDPTNALAPGYGAVRPRRISAYQLAFSVQAPKDYASSGRLVVTRAQDTLTGYVVAIVTLPTSESATAAKILASLRVSSARSG
jgi:hypothetical protein